MFIGAGLRLLCVIINDDVWRCRGLYGTHERRDRNTDREEEEKEEEIKGVSVDAIIIKSTVKALVDLCNVLDEQYSNRDEMVRMLRTQGHVTLSLLLQASPLAKKYFMEVQYFSESNNEKVRTYD